jgi:ferredoxin, 2Fe-2S
MSHKVTFLPAHVTVDVDEAEYPYADHGKPGSLLDIALKHKIKLEHNCGGNCACTTCHVIVREGFESLSPSTDEEDDLLDRAWGLTSRSRLSCQARLGQKDVVVEIPRYSINQVKERH